MFVKLSIFILVFCLFFVSGEVFAQTSCCSQNGGQYACDTSTNKLYCKDGTVSKECICKLSTPTPSPSPIPTPSLVPVLPACVPYSTYDSAANNCKCNSGYIVKDNSCVSYGEYCRSTFGGNSIYDSEKNNCTCNAGYAMNSDGKKCISYEDICHAVVGDKSFFNTENRTCNCYPGYYIKDNKCQLIPPTAIVTPPLIQEVRISQIPTPTPQLEKEKSSFATAKTRSVKNASTIVVKDDTNKNFVAVKKPQKNVIQKIISVFRNLLSSIL